MGKTVSPQSMRTALSRWSMVLGFLLLGALGACGTQEPAYSLENITGLMPRLKFDLTNQDGAKVTADDYRNQLVLLYFGFTQCPDVCPTTLATLSRALRELGGSASRVRVLFVSVDPSSSGAMAVRGFSPARMRTLR